MPGMTIHPWASTSQMSVRTIATIVIVTPERRVEPRTTSCTISTISSTIARIKTAEWHDDEERQDEQRRDDDLDDGDDRGAASANADDAVDQGEDAAQETDDEEPGQGDHGGFLP